MFDFHVSLFLQRKGILYKYPKKEHEDLPFPNEVSSFGLPMGAVIENWPNSTINGSTVGHHHTTSPYLAELEPTFNTFVLNVNSNDGLIMEKVYGACIIFYERFDHAYLTETQRQLLCSPSSATTSPSKRSLANDELNLHSNKCLMVLSRNPLFDTFKSFLMFLLRKYTSKYNSNFFQQNMIPIER